MRRSSHRREIVSLLIGATLLGVTGVVLAILVAAITKALLSTYVRRHQLIEELDVVEAVEQPARRSPEPREITPSG